MDAEKLTDPGEQAWRREGVEAYKLGEASCPHDYLTHAAQWWRRGWAEAQAAALYHRSEGGSEHLFI
jgi:hypothetical protein